EFSNSQRPRDSQQVVPALTRNSPHRGQRRTRLLEEEGDASVFALRAQVQRPVGLHWTSAWAALAADNQPINSGQRQIRKCLDQRLAAQKTDGTRNVNQQRDTFPRPARFLNGRPKPNIRTEVLKP